MWRSDPQIPEVVTDTRTPEAVGSGRSTTRMPSDVLLTPRTGLAAGYRLAGRDGEDVGIGSGDPRDVIGHELVLVGLGLVGFEGLFGLPALEEPEPAGRG